MEEAISQSGSSRPLYSSLTTVSFSGQCFHITSGFSSASPSCVTPPLSQLFLLVLSLSLLLQPSIPFHFKLQHLWSGRSRSLWTTAYLFTTKILVALGLTKVAAKILCYPLTKQYTCMNILKQIPIN